MKVSIVTIAYNLPDATSKLVETAMLDSNKHDITFYLFLHSQDRETVCVCEAISTYYPTVYHPYGTNRGLANSWNEGMLEAYNDGADVVIIANDDTYFTAGDLDKLAVRARLFRNNYMVSVAGPHLGAGKWERSHGYSIFAINPIAIEKIGCFDQNIFPIYMEDCDHHRRATLLGLIEENCHDTMITHGGSSALAKSQELSLQNLVTQRKNGEYYVAKWGGINEHEVYTRPFNDKKFGLRIDPKDRFAPYPGHNRSDQDMVKL